MGLKMIIHKPIKKEKDYLMSFVEIIFTEHQDLKHKTLKSMKSKLNNGIYSLDGKKGLVVVATTHSSTWHPHCVYICLAYDLNRFEKSDLLLMIDFLKSEFEKPLYFLIDDRFDGLDKLLLEEGFRFIRKTEIINIYPQKSEIAELDNVIKTVAQISHDPTLMSSLVELCKSIYKETHVDNPVADIPISGWKNMIMADLIEENSYIVLNDNSVISFSFMHQGDEEDGWELGWLGVEEGSELTLLDSLLNRQLRDAVECGIVTIEKEVDTTCPYSLHIAKLFSHNLLNTWYAFIE